MNYINTFLNLKVEASGYPGWVRSPEDEDRYIESFWQREGIRLDMECIRSSAAKRVLAEAERKDRTITNIITEPKELCGFLATPGIEVVNLVFASDDVVWLSWKRGAEEEVPNFRHTNEVIGAYVTAGAGIHL